MTYHSNASLSKLQMDRVVQKRRCSVSDQRRQEHQRNHDKREMIVLLQLSHVSLIPRPSSSQDQALTYGIKAPYAASLLPMTTKLQKAAPILKRFDLG
jgi:hypothetical protein